MTHDGVKPSCFAVYIQTHAEKDGRAIDDVSANAMVIQKKTTL